MSDLFVCSQASTDDNATYHPVEEENKSKSITFTASTTQISHLADMFSAITAINNQALMIIKPSGIVLYTEYNHICNVQLTIDPSLFQIYNLYGESDDTSQDTSIDLRLGIDIGLITESFNSVSASSAFNKRTKGGENGNSKSNENVTCFITYNGEGNLLIIEFEDNLMSEKIEFVTFYTDFIYPYDVEYVDGAIEENFGLVINHNEIQFELMLKSDVLTPLLQDLHQIDTSELYIYVSNERKMLGSRKYQNIGGIRGPSFIENQLNFISKGPIGYSKLIYPNEKTILERILIFEKEAENLELKEINKSLISCYNFNIFIKILKAVKLSSKCKVLKDLNGILSIQLLCKNSRIPNYSGTLIRFNMLELSTVTEDYDSRSGINLNNIFDDETYEYIKVYDAANPHSENNRYESVYNRREEREENTNEPINLSYALFRQDLDGAGKSNEELQIGNFAKSNEQIQPESTSNKRVKKNNNNEEGTARGIIDVPLFL